MKCLLAAALLVAPLHAQITMPAWLAPYPESTPQIRSFPAYTESSYTTAATPAAVLDHYRKLFETAGLAFVPNSDGVGNNVRTSVPECDLLLSIRPQSTGSSVRVNCAAKSPSYTTEVASITTTPPRTGQARRIQPPPPAPSTAEMMERHQQMVATLGIHPVYQDAPAPPLVWPGWLVHLDGSRLGPSRGVDQSRQQYLEAKYRTTAPMTAIFTFYEDLLKANGYPVHNSKLGTGSTMRGVQQNADGYVEGTNYPNGHPGPRTVIRVDFSRFYLNEPISVRVRFTTYSFEAPRR